MAEIIYENGLRFECARCSYCCGNGPGVVYLSEQDLENLCVALKIDAKECVEKYCRWVMYYGGVEVLALQENEKYTCILWNNGCSVYEGRPLQCSTYPFWSWMIADKETWNECSKTCPGMNNGKLWSKELILEQKKLFDSIVPLSKDDFDKIEKQKNESK